MKLRRLTAGPLPRLILASAVAGTLSACGGGGAGAGDGAGGEFIAIGDADVNSDGITDTSFGDIDGDGIEDYDIDGDGNFDTLLGLGAYDVNGDGVEDFDVNEDGTVDLSVADANNDGEPDYDTNGDGNADVTASGASLLQEPNAEFPCGSATGEDNVSANNTWTDNCTVSGQNQFRNSLYTAGIQRIVWCAGYDGGTGAASVDAFTDGDWGPGTQAAVEAYQAARGLVPDGIVGPSTWQALQNELTNDPLEFAQENGTEPYGVEGDRCSALPLFLNTIVFENNMVIAGGWQLTQGATNDAAVPFSIGTPFGVVD